MMRAIDCHVHISEYGRRIRLNQRHRLVGDGTLIALKNARAQLMAVTTLRNQGSPGFLDVSLKNAQL